MIAYSVRSAILFADVMSRMGGAAVHTQSCRDQQNVFVAQSTARNVNVPLICVVVGPEGGVVTCDFAQDGCRSGLIYYATLSHWGGHSKAVDVHYKSNTYVRALSKLQVCCCPLSTQPPNGSSLVLSRRLPGAVGSKRDPAAAVKRSRGWRRRVWVGGRRGVERRRAARRRRDDGGRGVRLQGSRVAVVGG